MRYAVLISIICLSACSLKKTDDTMPSLPPQQHDTPHAGTALLPPAESPSTTITIAYPPVIGGQGSGGGHNTPREDLCGNGLIDGSEICDDGNRINNDGCSNKCQSELGFPLCSWACDDPQCSAQCEPHCAFPQCSARCAQPPPQENCLCESTCLPMNCQVECPNDGCETEHCPACQTICEPPLCHTECQKISANGPDCVVPKPECETVCEPTKCAWECVSPDCTRPYCELQCERVPNNCQE